MDRVECDQIREKSYYSMNQLRIPMKSAMHSNSKPASDSDLKPAGYSDLMLAT